MHLIDDLLHAQVDNESTLLDKLGSLMLEPPYHTGLVILQSTCSQLHDALRPWVHALTRRCATEMISFHRAPEHLDWHLGISADGLAGVRHMRVRRDEEEDEDSDEEEESEEEELEGMVVQLADNLQPWQYKLLGRCVCPIGLLEQVEALTLTITITLTLSLTLTLALTVASGAGGDDCCGKEGAAITRSPLRFEREPALCFCGAQRCHHHLGAHEG